MMTERTYEQDEELTLRFIESAIEAHATGKLTPAEVGRITLLSVRALVRVHEQDPAEDDAILVGHVIANAAVEEPST
jgi:hypothetical protein